MRAAASRVLEIAASLVAALVTSVAFSWASGEPVGLSIWASLSVIPIIGGTFLVVGVPFYLLVFGAKPIRWWSTMTSGFVSTAAFAAIIFASNVRHQPLYGVTSVAASGIVGAAAGAALWATHIALMRSNNRFDRDGGAISFGRVGGGSMIKIKELRFASPAPRRGQPER